MSIRSFIAPPSVLIVGALILGALSPVTGQAPDSQPKAPPQPKLWEAELRYDHDLVLGDRPDWHRWNLSMQRKLGNGTVIASLLRQQRFDRTDEGFGAGLWHDLWSKAYGSVQAELSPSAHVRPRGSIQLELYQQVGAWEVFGQYNLRRYRLEDVQLINLGTSFYIGDWYLHGQTTLLPRLRAWPAVLRLGARYYLGTADSYVGALAGAGHALERVGSRSSLEVVQTYFAAARLRHLLTPHLGLTLSARYKQITLYQTAGLSVGLIARW